MGRASPRQPDVVAGAGVNASRPHLCIPPEQMKRVACLHLSTGPISTDEVGAMQQKVFDCVKLHNQPLGRLHLVPDPQTQLKKIVKC